MKCFGAWLWVLAIVGLLCGEPHVDPETRLIFPDDCGGWKKVSREEYPQKELGFSIGYGRGQGKTLTVYLYSRGYAEIPSGGENAIVAQNIRDTAADVVQAWTDRGGVVEEILPVTEVRTDPVGRVQALMIAHRIKMPGEVLFSISGLTGYRGKLLKIRYTYSRHPLDEGFDELARFVTALLEENRATLDEFFTAAPQERSASTTPTREEVERAIETLETKLLTAEAPAAAAVVVAFAEKSEDVTIMLGPETTPWVLEGEATEETMLTMSTMLLAVYLAGNTKAQLAAGRADDAILAGWLAVLRAYRKIKHATGFSSAAIDELARLQAEDKLKEHADAVKTKLEGDAGDGDDRAPSPAQPRAPIEVEPEALRKV